MNPTRKRLPSTVTAQLDVITDALAAVARGEEEGQRAVDALDQALRAARVGSGNPWLAPFASSMSGIIGDRIKELRNEAGWTQAQLAESMQPYFPKWTRMTVAEVETEARKVAWDELVVLAALFAEPVVAFLVPTGNVALRLPMTGDLRKEELRDILVGQGGVLGAGGLAWPLAQRIAGEPGPRPATDLWTQRKSGTESTTDRKGGQ